MNGGKKEKNAPKQAHSKSLMRIKVRDIMNRKPPTADSDILIGDLIKRLRKQREDYLLIIDRDRNLVGLVTESDILHAFKTPSRHAFVGALAVMEMGKGTATKANEIMTRRPVTAEPDMSVREALNIMIAHKFRHLPVVDHGKLVGSVAIRNILDIIE